eukprot:2339818-Rhodomonas_salina.3
MTEATTNPDANDANHAWTNPVELEVVRVASTIVTSDDMEEEKNEIASSFERELFASKKAHRVACLLASARLLSQMVSVEEPAELACDRNCEEGAIEEQFERLDSSAF